MKKVIGRVVKKSSDKTIKVEVTYNKKNLKYKKNIIMKMFYLVHDEKNLAKENDIITITQSRPYSKRKRWSIIY